MNTRLLKGIIAGFVTFTVMISITAGISAFIGYKLIKGRLEYNSNTARMTGIVVGTLLSNLRSELNEGLQKSGQDAFDAKWSAFFNKMVRDSDDRADSIRIEEIFLLNRKGETIAHSDVTKLSKFFTEESDKKELVRVGGRNPHSPYFVKVISRLKNDGLMDPNFYEIASSYIPDLLAEKYSVGVAVFPVDSEIANATLHITIRNTTFPDFYRKLKYIAFRIVIADFLITSFISFFVMLVVIIAAGKNSAVKERTVPQKMHRREVSASVPEGMEIYESESRPISSVGDQKQLYSGKTSVILDAIPLDDIRRGN